MYDVARQIVALIEQKRQALPSDEFTLWLQSQAIIAVASLLPERNVPPPVDEGATLLRDLRTA